MYDEGSSGVWATNTLHSRAFSHLFSHVYPYFLTALLAYGVVASRLGHARGF
jgi:hypothetical protein